jgi:hypothetical protein
LTTGEKSLQLTLHVYTTGAEMLIVFRTTPARRTPDAAQVQRNAEIAGSLRVNGLPVTLQAGQHYPYGFTYRAWVGFGLDDDDLAFALPISGSGSDERRVPMSEVANAGLAVTDLAGQ